MASNLFSTNPVPNTSARHISNLKAMGIIYKLIKYIKLTNSSLDKSRLEWNQIKKQKSAKKQIKYLLNYVDINIILLSSWSFKNLVIIINIEVFKSALFKVHYEGKADQLTFS